jgi:hypothetical protein
MFLAFCAAEAKDWRSTLGGDGFLASSAENLLQRILTSWAPRKGRYVARSHACQCGRTILFRESKCRGCDTPLGYEPRLRKLGALVPGAKEGTWRLSSGKRSSAMYRRCGNFDSPAACNWLVSLKDPSALCISCRLNRHIPDLGDADNRRYWAAIEIAKRRMVAQLLTLGLPVRSMIGEDPEHGVAFDLLRSPPAGPRVMTGHGGGLITLNVEEADDAKREQIRHDLREPYRTLLGHFRHEIGHYYWDRLIARTVWHEPFRRLFGDERADYAAALEANYEEGASADWADRHISSYASIHPSEDWAETWAHYLHLLDSLSTAIGFGFTRRNAEVEVETFSLSDLYAPAHPDSERVLSLVNSWVALTIMLNELARSMGQPDFYPFVLSPPVLRKLHFIHLVVNDEQAYAAGA